MTRNPMDPRKSPTGPLVRAAARNMLRIGWQEAHDEFCDFGADCVYHKNPYGKPPE
jgi:hypothetical protein